MTGLNNPTIDTTDRTDTDAVIEAAHLARPHIDLDVGEVHALPDSMGGYRIVDLDTDDYRKRVGATPPRKTGAVAFTEHASLSRYVNHHGEPEATELWADRDAGRIIAVLNGHLAEDDTAGWGDHRATLTLRQTPPWREWTASSGHLVDQERFANFLEDHLGDIVDPDGAHLLEVATSIQANTGAAFKSAVRLDSGEVQFRYEETVDARAGRAGELTIPARITLALAPFEGVDPYKVEARVRYRVANGALTIGVVLDRPDDVLRAAFGDIVTQVEAITDQVVLYGTPTS